MDPGQEGADEEWRPSKQPKDEPGAGLILALLVIVLTIVLVVILVQCSQGWQSFT